MLHPIVTASSVDSICRTWRRARVWNVHAFATALTWLSNRRWLSNVTPSDFSSCDSGSEVPATVTVLYNYTSYTQTKTWTYSVNVAQPDRDVGLRLYRPTVQIIIQKWVWLITFYLGLFSSTAGRSENCAATLFLIVSHELHVVTMLIKPPRTHQNAPV